ncbi:HXXEE domain-containing protein [Clostridium saccharoperbutylacetonicum]|uniref:HXXEE domain-containing protein n=1 Tax=Clostridium saccharoperbutylacetonicum N1-4(HMT) TaxID=931276 RepID=M1MCE0_9CLOT|nr:HXXEE domain-containing protein [Clostridium saccharoperbutylacetonicum]AGF55584.1 hypothetical protein Cspa_c18140 [Clostridium saccharoperbutylacetonicum N1-4(HMT)]AQR94427.1 hypothetical protein CLSAP_17340 [Clostridium saccharoperbutylacetonicum]NRT63695.1 hypothetical protein [Clostridium saccharoperbutylacetonicum]NSB27058.1 hypothetical protein [Clostridium saccharoperbutylacetonicum]NSB30130.1 hypothetical protein [Clostridium saccharoperbutylacetonicum]
MVHEYFLWIATLAYGLHIVEEMVLDWRGWARGFLKLPAEWNEFYVFNAVVILYGCISAIIGWKCPMIALSYPALMLINTVFFHLLPVLKSGRFSPGLFTALILFVPIAALTYYGASVDDVISIKSIVFSTVFGIIFMAYPITLQILKTKPFFLQQNRND